MVSNWTLAKMFAEGATKGKGNHTFIEGDTIYSFGLHFPIAMRLGEGLDTILINEDKYSVSTSKHQSYVRQAVISAGLKPMKSSTTAIQSYAEGQQRRKTSDQFEKRKPDLVDDIMAYEAGDMTPEQEQSFFRKNKDTLIHLQGHYGRQLQARGLLTKNTGQGGYFRHRKEHSINRRQAYKRQGR